MKTSFKFLLLASSIFIMAGCGEATDADVLGKGNEPIQESNVQDEGPTTIFEGTWLWVKTEGETIAGPYTSDSTTVGYSLRYKFGYSDLQTYKNSAELEHYTYVFTFNEGNPLGARLELTKDNGDTEYYFYEIQSSETEQYLILKNETCCDNTFKQYYKLILPPSDDGD